VPFFLPAMIVAIHVVVILERAVESCVSLAGLFSSE